MDLLQAGLDRWQSEVWVLRKEGGDGASHQVGVEVIRVQRPGHDVDGRQIVTERDMRIMIWYGMANISQNVKNALRAGGRLNVHC